MTFVALSQIYFLIYYLVNQINLCKDSDVIVAE